MSTYLLTLCLLAAPDLHRPPIYDAIDKGDTAYIAECPRDEIERSFAGWTPFLYSAKFGSLATVRGLLNRGVDITVRDQDGSNALHYGIANDRAEVLRFLAKSMGARALQERSKTGLGGLTPLHWAARATNLQAIRCLLDEGAHVNSEAGVLKLTPLDLAAGMGDLRCARTLLEFGADINHQGNRGHTPLVSALLKKREELAIFLIQSGAKLDILYCEELDAFRCAAMNGCDKVLAELVRMGAATVKTKSPSGTTALHAAALRGHTSTVRFLIECGTAVDATNNHGETALLSAAFKGHLAVVRSLLKSGADPNVRSKSGQTALTFASSSSHWQIVKLLLNWKATVPSVPKGQIPPLGYAILARKPAVVDLMCHNKADPNQVMPDGRTAFLWAATLGDPLTVRALSNAGAHLNESSGPWKRTPLHVAVMLGHTEIADYLVSKGANRTLKDSYGIAPFEYIEKTRVILAPEIKRDLLAVSEKRQPQLDRTNEEEPEHD